MLQVTELIADQARATAVMMGCGVLVESLWQAKSLIKKRAAGRFFGGIVEILFWTAAGAAVSMFLYYCDFGRITLHSAAGFFTGLLLWKKMCCVIIGTWVNAGEAENLKTTAKSSTWKRRGEKDRKSAGRKDAAKRRHGKTPPGRDQEGKWLSEGAGTDGA